MPRPRLSICIATYNRAEFIGETLESIIPQITDEVEIVIVDGASSDGTDDVVKKYVDSCKQISYAQLSVKGGVDQDFNKAVELAKGEYCWLFSDDDVLKENAVEAVLDEISKGYSLIVVNAQVMIKDFSQVLQSRCLKIETDEIYSSSEMEKLFKFAILYMSYIGSVVIHRDLWIKREKNAYYGTEFVHLGVIFQAPLPKAALIIAEPYITIRYGNAQWTKRAVEIWLVKWPNLLSSFTHISEQVRKECQMVKFWPVLKNMLVFRATNSYSFKEYLRWVSLKKSSIWSRFIAFLIVAIPVRFLRFILLFYLKLLKKESRTTIYDLERQ